MAYCLTVTAGVGCEGVDKLTERYAWRKLVELTRTQRREECLWLEPATEELDKPNTPFTCIDFDLDECEDSGVERDERGHPILTGTFYGSQEGEDTNPDEAANLPAIHAMLTKHGFVQCEGQSPPPTRPERVAFDEHANENRFE